MLLETAHQIGLRIARAALWDGDACAWMLHLPDRSGSGRWTAQPVNATLYSGTAGIGYFLAELFALTHDPEVGAAARGALHHAAAQGAAMANTAFGFHQGRVGVAYALARGARALDAPELAREAGPLLLPLANREAEDQALDVMGGAAGAIPVLLGMGPELEPPATREVAVRLGEHLLRTARREPGGWSWGTAGLTHVRRLAGMGHGAAGIGHALLELYRATGDPRFLYAGEQAFAYERQFFDEGERNWPDLRHPELARHQLGGEMQALRTRLLRGEDLAPPRRRFMTAWCYGAPGIGLVRLRAWQTTGRALYLAEAATAVETTAAWLEARHPARAAADLSLCHGVAGNAELLCTAAGPLGRPALRDRATAAVADAWRAFDAPDGRRRDLPLDAGLMLGEAGIGFGMLRMHTGHPPSVLLPVTDAPPPAQPAPHGAEALRRDAVSRWFGRTLAVRDRLYGAAWQLSPAAPEVPEVEAAYGRLRAELDAEPDPALRERLLDAFAPEEARYLATLQLADFTAGLLHALGRPAAADVPWEETRFRAAPGLRRVRCGWNWDAWLAGGAPGPGPEQEPAEFAVAPAVDDVRIHRLSPLSAAVIDALATPASPAEVAARLAGRAGAEAGALEAAARTELERLYNASLVCIAPDSG